MAKLRQTLEAFVSATEASYSTWRRTADELIDEGLLPRGTIGGGANTPHLTAEHLKNLLLAGSADLPAKASATVVALDGLEVVPVTSPLEGGFIDRIPAGITLGEYVVNGIEEWAEPSPEMQIIASRAKAYPVQGGWSLEMIPAAPYACVHALTGERVIDYRFIPKQRPAGRPLYSVHKFEIMLPVLVLAGELLADTLRQRGPLIPDPSTSGKRKGTATGNEKAATGTNRRGSSKMQPANQPHSRTPHKVQATPGEGGASTRSLLSSGDVSVSQVVRGSPPTSNSLEVQHGRRMDASDPRGSGNLRVHGGHTT